ncbi:MAG TPA: 30S ribosomal protein S8 [Candidatus Paceibacterota bacterium]
MDPIADMLIQIKNAGNAGKESVSFPHSKVKLAIAQVLLKEGYIASVNKKTKKDDRSIDVGVMYENGNPKIKGVQRVSKPSRRIYLGVKEVHPVRQGFGCMVLSTPRGILTGKEARKEKVGGEVLFKVW